MSSSLNGLERVLDFFSFYSFLVGLQEQNFDQNQAVDVDDVDQTSIEYPSVVRVTEKDSTQGGGFGIENIPIESNCIDNSTIQSSIYGFLALVCWVFGYILSFVILVALVMAQLGDARLWNKLSWANFCWLFFTVVFFLFFRLGRSGSSMNRKSLRR